MNESMNRASIQPKTEHTRSTDSTCTVKSSASLALPTLLKNKMASSFQSSINMAGRVDGSTITSNSVPRLSAWRNYLQTPSTKLDTTVTWVPSIERSDNLISHSFLMATFSILVRANAY